MSNSMTKRTNWYEISIKDSDQPVHISSLICDCIWKPRTLIKLDRYPERQQVVKAISQGH